MLSTLRPFLASWALVLCPWAGDRVPHENWLRYADVAEAGFDPVAMAGAEEAWSRLPSSAFLVVADGAVVAAWGDVERRFMCHSVRKSFLSALYGVAWDHGRIELNKTLADLGIDDDPDPLLDGEKQARIIDLLQARSGVFHPAAYAGRTDSRPRGSEGPGRYFAYNNWDFNTLAAIYEQETGSGVFEAFERDFGTPLAMEDWRLSDGYYHLESDKSRYPAYPFRLSARDAARFGLLHARRGLWGDRRLLSRHWIDLCGVPFSIDSEVMGYGLLWWVFRQPRFARFGMIAALGVGNQMIAVLPEIDLVIVNRADTYAGESTPTGALLDLVESLLAARVGEPSVDPKLVPLANEPAEARATSVAPERLAEFVGTWSDPPAALGLATESKVEISARDGHLSAHFAQAGTFALYLQPDGTLFQEDSREILLAVRDEAGRIDGVAGVDTLASGALTASIEGRAERARAWLGQVEGLDRDRAELGRGLIELFSGDSTAAEASLRRMVTRVGAQAVESQVNLAGYALLQSRRVAPAQAVFELNTRLFPLAFNTWDSLGELFLARGDLEPAREHYRRSLQLNPASQSAKDALRRIEDAQNAPQ